MGARLKVALHGLWQRTPLKKIFVDAQPKSIFLHLQQRNIQPREECQKTKKLTQVLRRGPFRLNTRANRNFPWECLLG